LRRHRRARDAAREKGSDQLPLLPSEPVTPIERK